MTQSSDTLSAYLNYVELLTIIAMVWEQAGGGGE